MSEVLSHSVGFSINNTLGETSRVSLNCNTDCMVDNLLYLSDLGAPKWKLAELQFVLDETDIPKHLMKSLSLKEYKLSNLQQKIAKEVEEKMKQHRRSW